MSEHDPAATDPASETAQQADPPLMLEHDSAPAPDPRLAIRAGFDNVRAHLVHAANGDHGAMAAAVLALVDLLDRHVG